MTETKTEKKGDILLGAHLTKCRREVRQDKTGRLFLIRNPLLAGQGGKAQASRTETRPGGWSRKVLQEVDTTADDPTRAASRFKVLSVIGVPPSDPGFNGRDAGYGGGVQITVKRLDGTGERIRYTRGCAYDTDVDAPAILVDPT